MPVIWVSLEIVNKIMYTQDKPNMNWNLLYMSTERRKKKVKYQIEGVKHMFPKDSDQIIASCILWH